MQNITIKRRVDKNVIKLNISNNDSKESKMKTI